MGFWSQLIDQDLLLRAQRQEIAVDMPDVLKHAVAKSFGSASMDVGHTSHRLHQGGFATSISANKHENFSFENSQGQMVEYVMLVMLHRDVCQLQKVCLIIDLVLWGLHKVIVNHALFLVCEHVFDVILVYESTFVES